MYGISGKWPAFTADSNHRDKVLEHTVRSNTTEASDAPQDSPSTSINAVYSETSDILGPGLSIASAAMSESGSNRSSEPGALSMDLFIELIRAFTSSRTELRSGLSLHNRIKVTRPDLCPNASIFFWLAIERFQ